MVYLYPQTMQKGSSAHLLDRLRLVFARKQCCQLISNWNDIQMSSTSVLKLVTAKFRDMNRDFGSWVEVRSLLAPVKFKDFRVKLAEKAARKLNSKVRCDRLRTLPSSWSQLWQAMASYGHLQHAKSIKIHQNSHANRTGAWAQHSFLHLWYRSSPSLSLYLSRSLRYV